MDNMDEIDTALVHAFSNLRRILSNAEVSKIGLIEEIQVLTEKMKDPTERYASLIQYTRSNLFIFNSFTLNRVQCVNMVFLMSRDRLKFTLCRLNGGLLSNLGTHKLRNIPAEEYIKLHVCKLQIFLTQASRIVGLTLPKCTEQHNNITGQRYNDGTDKDLNLGPQNLQLGAPPN